MKRILSLVLVLTLVLGSVPVAFAAEETAGDKLKAAGFVAGDQNGNLMEDQKLTREQMMVLIAEMNGVKEEAATFGIPHDFSDVASDDWFAPYVWYAFYQGWTAGMGDGTFGAGLAVDSKMAATFMLKALDYKVDDYNASVVQAAGVGIEIAAATEMTRAQGFEAMWSTVNLPKQGSTVALGVELGKIDAPNVGELEVAEIKASSAKSFVVKFNKAVADADKVTFSVKRLTTESTVTVAWNEAKTEATLTSASNFPESTFTVAVMADAKEIAKETIAMTAQKVAKIEITSETLSATVDTNTGYVNYKVYDQYNNDITSTAKANALAYQFGLSGYNVTLKNGLMKIDGSAAPANTTKLITVQSVSVVIYDSSAGVTATAGLPVSTAVGTLTSFTLGSTDAVKLVEGDTTSVYYIPYTAIDMSGQETKDFELVKNGLIDSTTGGDVDLVVSLSNNVTAKVVQDPANSKLAAIEVKYKTSVPASNFVMDMPVTITAMTYGGNSSVVNTTIAKAKAVDTIYLMAPAETVSTNEEPEIPFEAYDQNGNKITSFRYVNETTITSNGFKIIEKADGNAKFVMDPVAAKGLVTLSANVVKSGKVSNLLSINVQDTAVPTSIGFKQDSIINAMEHGAVQKIDFTGSSRDIVVYDQYDRVMSDSKIDAAFGANDGAGSDYHIAVTVTGDASVNNATIISTDDIQATANAIAGGSATLQFALTQDLAAGDKILDTASTSLSVIKTSDIKAYQINTAEKAIYTATADGNTYAAATAQEKEYAFGAEVYGETDAGSKVLLAGTPIVSAAVSNEDDFSATVIAVSGAYDAVSVIAEKFPTGETKTSATTDLVITVAHNNVVKPLKVVVTSSTTAPVAQDIEFEGADDDGIYELTDAGVSTHRISKYDGAGAKTASDFYFMIKDSYGEYSMDFVRFNIAKIYDTSAGANMDLTNMGANTTAVTADGVLTVDRTNGTALAVGDEIHITAVTNNGLSATMKVVIK